MSASGRISSTSKGSAPTDWVPSTTRAAPTSRQRRPISTRSKRVPSVQCTCGHRDHRGARVDVPQQHLVPALAAPGPVRAGPRSGPRAPHSRARRVHACTFPGNCSCVSTTFCPGSIGDVAGGHRHAVGDAGEDGHARGIAAVHQRREEAAQLVARREEVVHVDRRRVELAADARDAGLLRGPRDRAHVRAVEVVQAVGQPERVTLAGQGFGHAYAPVGGRGPIRGWNASRARSVALSRRPTDARAGQRRR